MQQKSEQPEGLPSSRLRKPGIYSVIVCCSAILIGVVASRDFIFQEGYLFLAETYEVYNLEQFIRVVYPVWSEKLQGFVFGDISKMYVILPLAAVVSVFGDAAYKVFQAVLLVAPFSVAFFSSFKLTEYITSKFNGKSFQVFVSSMLAAFIYTVNPWFATNPRDYMFRIEYAVLPLSIFLFLKILRTRQKKYVAYLALVLSVVATYRNLLLTGLVFAIIFLIFILTSNRKEVFAKLLSVSFVVGLLFLLSAAKFVPSILHSGAVTPDAVENFNTNLIQRESISHIFTSKIVDWTAVGFELTYDDNLHVLFIAVTIFAFSYLLLLSRHQNPPKRLYFLLLFPLATYVSFMLLSAAEVNIDGIIVSESNPFSEELGRLLRHARWNVMPMLLSLAVMTAVSASMILSKLGNRMYAYVILAALLIITSSVSAWPIFSGDMNGYWRPSMPPEDYMQLNALLEREGGGHHITWFPQYFEKAAWSRSTGVRELAAPTGLFPIRSSELPTYRTVDYYFFDYYNPVRGVMTINPLPVYDGDLSEIYEPLNIKYFTVNYDTAWSSGRRTQGFTNDYLKETAQNISSSASVRTLYSGDYLTAFEMQNNAQEVYATKPVLMLDKLSTYGQLSPFIGQDSGIIFGTSLEAIDRGMEISDHIVISDSKDLLLLADGRMLVRPSDFTNVVEPRNVWSPSAIHNLAFFDFLASNGISWSWPFDFGNGLVYTSAQGAKLELKTNIVQEGEYRIFARYLANNDGGSFDATVGRRTVTVNTDREFGSAFEWADLGSHRLAEGTNNIVIENKDGSNVVNLIMLIPSVSRDAIYDNLAVDLSSKDLIYFFEAEHDFSERGQETRTISVNDGIRFVNSSALSLSVDFVKEGNYRFAVRGSGDFTVTFRSGGVAASFDLKSDSLNYIQSPPFSLENGTYELRVSASRGSFLDHAVLYSQNEDRTLDQMFMHDTADNQILSHEKIDPTTHKLRVRAGEPFLLAFAEGYDRFWTAEVNTAGGVKQYRPTELYGTINGFWIDEVGEYDISIRYQPQEWFYGGAAVSLSTFVAVAIYLIHPGIFSRFREKIMSRTRDESE